MLSRAPYLMTLSFLCFAPACIGSVEMEDESGALMEDDAALTAEELELEALADEGQDLEKHGRRGRGGSSHGGHGHAHGGRPSGHGSYCNPRRPDFGDPLAGLDDEDEDAFEDGLEAFVDEKTVAEGLGPVFNAPSCVDCHNAGGAGIDRRFAARNGRALCRSRFNDDPSDRLGGDPAS